MFVDLYKEKELTLKKNKIVHPQQLLKESCNILEIRYSTTYTYAMQTF